jgi:hypothetical protein
MISYTNSRIAAIFFLFILILSISVTLAEEAAAFAIKAGTDNETCRDKQELQKTPRISPITRIFNFLNPCNR